MTDLAALRQLLDAATPGPWKVFDDERPGIDQADPDGLNIIYGSRFGTGGFGGVGLKQDAALIVAAVNALPDLLDALEAAEARGVTVAPALDVERLTVALSALRNHDDPMGLLAFDRREAALLIACAYGSAPAVEEEPSLYRCDVCGITHKQLVAMCTEHLILPAPDARLRAAAQAVEEAWRRRGDAWTPLDDAIDALRAALEGADR